jgi:hypothetical protein
MKLGHSLLKGCLVKRYLLLICASAVLVWASCGGGGGSSSSGSGATQTTGTITTTISDPPTCLGPRSLLTNVWVTITKVQANINSGAGPTDNGWVTLVDLSKAPKQVDLLSLASTTCLLTQLGSTSGLPPGNYQQIRIYLLSNSPASGQAVPSPNACGNHGYNCVVLGGNIVNTVEELDLSSESQTGIKIPSGQIAGGGINLTAGEAADINIDFSACDSIVQEGNAQFRLIPVLHAGEVSQNGNAISGTVMDNFTKQAIPGAIVAVEQPDSSGIDRVIQTTITASNGGFIFCPLPSGNFDLVADASVAASGITTTYNPTVTTSVPLGVKLSTVPLAPESGSTGPNSLPVTINGTVTTSNASNQPTGADIQLSALIQATSGASSPLTFTVPLFPGSMNPVSTSASSNCSAGTDCASYTLLVPGSNPMVGAYNSSGATYSPPQPANVLYEIEGEAFVPSSGAQPDCSPSAQTTPQIQVTLGVPVTAPTLVFTECQ